MTCKHVLLTLSVGLLLLGVSNGADDIRPPKMNIENDWSKLVIESFKEADPENTGKLSKEVFQKTLQDVLVFAGSEEEKEMMVKVTEEFIEKKIKEDEITMDEIQNLIDSKTIIYFVEDWRIRMVEYLIEKAELFSASDPPEVQNYFKDNPYLFGLNYEMWLSYNEPPIDIDAVFDSIREKREKRKQQKEGGSDENQAEDQQEGLTQEDLENVERLFKSKEDAPSVEEFQKRLEGLIDSTFEGKEKYKPTKTQKDKKEDL